MIPFPFDCSLAANTGGGWLSGRFAGGALVSIRRLAAFSSIHTLSCIDKSNTSYLPN
jgi:hypothetical protein